MGQAFLRLRHFDVGPGLFMVHKELRMKTVFNRHEFKSLRQKLRKAHVSAEELLWKRIRY
jgi:hypothetical protein